MTVTRDLMTVISDLMNVTCYLMIVNGDQRVLTIEQEPDECDLMTVT